MYLSMYSERDRTFYAETALAPNYKRPKRILAEPVSPDLAAKYVLHDRRHFAQWKLRAKQTHATALRKQAARIHGLKQETAANHLNLECDDIHRRFWSEAPRMLPYQRRFWAQNFPEYYRAHTKLRHLFELMESDEFLWY